MGITNKPLFKAILSAMFGLGTLAIAPKAQADTRSDVNAAYADSVDALGEVGDFVVANEDDFNVLRDASVDIRQRAYDAVQLQTAVYACGVSCRPYQSTINAAVVNFEHALGDLEELGLTHLYYIDFCCTGPNGQGCSLAGDFWIECLGYCWSCNEGWTNEDGSLGCATDGQVECY